MTSLFPGMNPYLEAPDFWRGFHHHLSDEIVATLNATIGSKYFADVEVRTVFEENGVRISPSDIYPDAAVLEDISLPSLATTTTQIAVPVAPIQRTATISGPHKLRSVEVRETESGRLVTVIEILSPFNKRGRGLEEYREKRWRILASDLHLVELDFLRAGQRVAWEAIDPPIECDYLLLVNRGFQGSERRSGIWPIALNEKLPLCPIPLLPPDADAVVDLNDIMHQVNNRAAYARRIDYTQPVPPPALRPPMAEWLAEHLRT